MKKRILTGIILIFLSGAVICQENNTTVITTTTLVSYDVAITTYPVMALDKNGNLHTIVLYVSPPDSDYYDLRHIYWDGSNWQQSTIFNDFTESFGGDFFPNIIFDNDNRTYTTCVKRVSWSMCEIICSGGNVTKAIVDERSARGSTPRYLALDSYNNPVVVYTTSWGDLKMAWWKNGDWEITMLDPYDDSEYDSWTYYASCVVDKDDRVHVLYERRGETDNPDDGYQLIYLVYDNGAVTKIKLVGEETRDGLPLWDIRVDKENVIHIVYFRNWDNPELVYVKGGSEEIVNVGYGWYPVSLEFDQNGKPHIFWINQPPPDYNFLPYHAWKEDGIWKNEKLIDEEQEIVEISNGIIDKNGNIHIVYIVYNVQDSQFGIDLKHLFKGIIKDTSPPAKITDLSVYDCSVTSGSVTLTWTAPGDDGETGQAKEYDIRYSLARILTDTDFDSATQVTGEPTPQPAGAKETFTVAGLEQGAEYFFALKTIDDAGNVSELSNDISARTLINVPYFNQGDPQWKDEIYDSTGTIGRFGCALTSLAMINNYYRLYHPTETYRTKIPDTDPGKLNDWLKTNTGYSLKGDVVWGKIYDYSNQAIMYAGWDEIRNDEKVNESLKNIDPSILMVKYVIKETGDIHKHFVVVVGSCPTTYKINDPGRQQVRTLKDEFIPKNSELKTSYENTYYKIRLFKPGPGDASSISIQGR